MTPCPKPEPRGPKPRTRIKRSAPPARTSRPRPLSPRAAGRRTKDATWSHTVCERPGFRCERCGHPATPFIPLDAHHVLNKKVWPAYRHDPRVGVALCRVHHNEAHAEPLAFRAWLLTTLLPSLPYADARADFLRVWLARVA